VCAQPPHPCPVRALRAWLDAAQITHRPEFPTRHPHRRHLLPPHCPDRRADHQETRPRRGLDPREFAGHSLRSGYATQAACDGHHPTQIAATTRHQDQRVLAGYIRPGHGRDDIVHVLSAQRTAAPRAYGNHFAPATGLHGQAQRV
jgi:hypothetical protein